MNPALRSFGIVLLAACAGLPRASGGETEPADAADGKSVVLFRRKGPEGDPMARNFEAAREKLQAQARFLSVDADDPKEAATVRRYQIDRLEGPAILLLAADGTLLAGFVAPPDVAALGRVLASRVLPGFQRAMAGGGLLLVVVGDPKTEPFRESVAQASAYAAGTRDPETLLQVDGTDPAEAYLLERLGVKAGETALCILKAGRAVGKIPDKVPAGRIEELVTGCEDGGCGPEG